MTTGARISDTTWDDLVDRLAVHDIAYLTGGSAWEGRASPYRSPADAPVDRLILDLAEAGHGRLRNALVALLFRHPEYAPHAVGRARTLGHDSRARLVMLASVVAAAALQRNWRFVRSIYLPRQPDIDAAPIADELGLPDPVQDYGRPALRAAADMLRAGQPFPFNYERGWQDAIGHVLAGLTFQAADTHTQWPACL